MPPVRFTLRVFVIDETPVRATMPVNPLALIAALVRVVQRLLRPAHSAVNLAIGAARDLTRTRSELLAKNALLRQQLMVKPRCIWRPRVHRDDRLLLLILARPCRQWRDALHLVNPETLLRWHRDLFKIVWRHPICERFLSSVHRECLDHVFILSERQLRRVLKAYVEIYFNRARPHQCLW